MASVHTVKTMQIQLKSFGYYPKFMNYLLGILYKMHAALVHLVLLQYKSFSFDVDTVINFETRLK